MLYKKKDKINKSYDVIVIGSGLAGLTAANKLAKVGRKVLSSRGSDHLSQSGMVGVSDQCELAPPCAHPTMRVLIIM